MFETIFREKYSFKLIKMMVMNTFASMFITNLLAPVFSVYVLYSYLETNYLILFVALNILLMFLRIFNGKKILAHIKEDSDLVYFYLKINCFFTFLTAMFFGLVLWMAVLNSVPDLTIVVLAVIIVGLASGSIATLGAIYTLFMIFLSSNFLFLISALLYHGGEIFSIFALAMIIMFVTLTIAGYKHYIVLKDSISMDETFKNIYEGSTDGLVIIEGGKLVSCNQSMLNIFKIPSMELLLRSGLTRFSPELQPDGSQSIEEMNRMAQKAYEKGSSSFEWLHKNYYGVEFWCEVILTRIHLRGKDLLHGVWRDISQRKEMSQAAIEQKKEIELLNTSLESRVEEEVRKNMQKDRQLLQQSRLAQMGEMISMIAHQWRQPLTAISSTSSAIGLKASLGKLDSESAVQLADKISTYVQHLSETIDDFRNFFKQNREKVDTNYSDIIESVLHIIDMSLRSKKITLVQELECDVSFLAYPNELKQVVLNLLKNAEDALIEKNIAEPKIIIKSYKDNNRAVLIISDNAGGIDENIIEKIFDPYFSTKLKKDGTGLGLYMSKIIVEEHCRGLLTCKNVGDGLECKMEIPIA